jgi:isopenicillin N synthase-like dioxygenase
MDVKVCNLRSNEFDNDFRKSVMETGFAVLTHHGIDSGLIKEMQQAWRLFFLSEHGYKSSFINPKDPNMGYKGFKTEKAVGATKADLKEFFHWQPGSKVIPNEVMALTQHMFFQLQDIALKTLSVLDINGTKYAKDCENSNNTILRTLYYPAMDFVSEVGSVRAAAHEDINHITLLVAASAPGLQVLDKKGNWHDVPDAIDSIVLNVGDMLQLASKGLYKSTTHRVVNPTTSNSDRISMPLFLHPSGNTILADGITAQQFLNQRLDQIYQKGSK